MKIFTPQQIVESNTFHHFQRQTVCCSVPHSSRLPLLSLVTASYLFAVSDTAERTFCSSWTTNKEKVKCFSSRFENPFTSFFFFLYTRGILHFAVCCNSCGSVEWCICTTHHRLTLISNDIRLLKHSLVLNLSESVGSWAVRTTWLRSLFGAATRRCHNQMF